MTIRLLFLGKTKAEFRDALEDFEKKLRPFCHLEITTIKDETVHNDIKKLLKKEEERILQQVSDKDFLVVLDEKGKCFDTVSLAKYFNTITVQGKSRLTFVIGSAFGLSEHIKKMANLLFSLSPLTLSHQITRIVLIEQLYRVFTVLRGIDYHR